MEEHGRSAAPDGVAEDQTLAELFDPAALEARLVEARARRAEALARRRELGDTPSRRVTPSRPMVAALAATEPINVNADIAFLPTPALPTPAAKPPIEVAVIPAAERVTPILQPSTRRPAAMLALIFASGLGIGGAAVAFLIWKDPSLAPAPSLTAIVGTAPITEVAGPLPPLAPSQPAAAPVAPTLATSAVPRAPGAPPVPDMPRGAPAGAADQRIEAGAGPTAASEPALPADLAAPGPARLPVTSPAADPDARPGLTLPAARPAIARTAALATPDLPSVSAAPAPTAPITAPTATALATAAADAAPPTPELAPTAPAIGIVVALAAPTAAGFPDLSATAPVVATAVAPERIAAAAAIDAPVAPEPYAARPAIGAVAALATPLSTALPTLPAETARPAIAAPRPFSTAEAERPPASSDASAPLPAIAVATGPAAPPSPDIAPTLPTATQATGPLLVAGLVTPARETLPAPPETATPPVQAVARVYVHFPPSAAAEADAAASALRAAGLATVAAIPVDFLVTQNNLRYFHAADAPVAARVAGLVAGALDGPAPDIRDFTDFAPSPTGGTIEIWIAGTPPVAELPTATRRPAPGPARATRSAGASARQTEAEAREIRRILAERSVEQMVRDAMR